MHIYDYHKTVISNNSPKYLILVSSLLTPHPSLLTPHSSSLTPHSSPLTPHPSPLTPHHTHTQTVLHRMYLQKCWQWPFYGATFFPGNLATKSCKMPKQVHVYNNTRSLFNLLSNWFCIQVKLGRKTHTPVSIAVNTLGFHLISKETNVGTWTS